MAWNTVEVTIEKDVAKPCKNANNVAPQYSQQCWLPGHTNKVEQPHTFYLGKTRENFQYLENIISILDDHCHKETTSCLSQTAGENGIVVAIEKAIFSHFTSLEDQGETRVILSTRTAGTARLHSQAGPSE